MIILPKNVLQAIECQTNQQKMNYTKYEFLNYLMTTSKMLIFKANVYNKICFRF